MTSLPCVLAIEDDADILDSLRELFESEGFEVQSCASATCALERAAGLRKPDLIILDLSLRDLDPETFMERKLGDPRLSDAPVLLFSAQPSLDKVAEKIGAQGYVRKPADTETLISEVQRLIGPRP